MTGPRRDGYDSLHEFVEEMCAVARGDFLLLFNDDLTMDTQGWDTEIARFRDEFCVLHWQISPNRMGKNLFPVVHRKVHQIIGHFSKCGFCDTWVEDIARRAGIERFCPIRGTHRQREILENPDTTCREKMKKFSALERLFHSDELKSLRNADLAKVNAYLDRCGVKIRRIEDTA